MRKTTLGIIIQENKIFLGRKKKGMATGVYNGIGGKQEGVESIEACMIREAREEIGIEIIEKNLEEVGVIRSYLSKTPHYNTECHIFIIHKYEGDLRESDEIEPHWFDLKDIPYEKMWEDESIWLPKTLAGARDIEYTFYYDKDNGNLAKFVEGLE